MPTSQGKDQVQRIDQLLAALEHLIQQKTSPMAFHQATANVLCQMMPGGQLCVVYWLGQSSLGDQWLIEPISALPDRQANAGDLVPHKVADRSELDRESISCWLGSLNERGYADYRVVHFREDETWCLATRYTPRAPWGSLWWHTPGKLSDSMAATAMELMSALAEIWHRYWQHSASETHQAVCSDSIHNMSRWSTSDNREQAAYGLVNDLARAVSADRCGLLEWQGNSRPLLVAANGLADNKLQTEALQTWLGEIAAVQPTRLSLVRGSSQSRALILPLDSRHRIVCEWSDGNRALIGISVLSSTASILALVWGTILGKRRAGLLSNYRFSSRRASSSLKAIITLASLLIIATVLWGTRHWQVSLTINCAGSLQPVEQAWVFAPTDGFIDQVHVHDRQLVRKSERLVTLSAPNLNLQLQALASETETLQQKRLTLDIQQSESNTSTESGSREARRIAGEVIDIDARLEGLKGQRRALEEQFSRLNVISQLDGRVVGSELSRHLPHKPVRAGEYLLRVVNEQGAWQLVLNVPERDLGHVAHALENAQGRLSIHFTVVGRPEQIHTGSLTAIDAVAHDDPQHGRVVHVTGEVFDTKLPNVLVDSQVIASIDTGKHAWWFVVARPVIESLQRRGWL